VSVFGGVRSLRRSAVTLGLAAMVVVALPSWSPADTSGFSNGTASASSQAFKVNPTASALSLGVTFGISLAGYTNEVAKADARGIDLGIIGTILASAGCDGSAPTLAADQQPQPLAVDSRDPGAAQGKSAPETFMGNPVPGITKTVKATSAPLADAGVTIGQLGQPAAFTISGATSSARTEVIKGNIRQAVATADIGSLDIGGGAVKLGGLHWDITNHTGADTSTAHTFAIGSAVIGGTPVPTQDPAAVIAAANQALNPIGIEIRPPNFRQVNDGYTIVAARLESEPDARSRELDQRTARHTGDRRHPRHTAGRAHDHHQQEGSGPRPASGQAHRRDQSGQAGGHAGHGGRDRSPPAPGCHRR
jgi:hypothetical protein